MVPSDSLLVTGGAGFIGAHLVRALLHDRRYRGMAIVVLDDLSGGFRDNLPDSDRLEFVEASITDNAFVTELFEERRFRFVFHLAAYAAEGLSHFIRRFNYTNNLIGSVNLINAAIRAKTEHFVFTSSIAVYGAAQVPMTEDTVPKPEDPYGIAKFAVEQDLHAASQQFGIPFTIFRPHNVYGEFQNIGDRYRNVVGIFMNRIMQGRSLPIFGDGTQQRAFSYVGDLMPPMISAPFVAKARGKAFNIGAKSPVTVLELARAVCREFDVDPKFEFLPARNEVKVAWSDHTLCEHAFGQVPETDLKAGLHRMATWARAVGPREGKSFDEIEIAEKLPAGWMSRR